jgi:hypothetical protein
VNAASPRSRKPYVIAGLVLAVIAIGALVFVLTRSSPDHTVDASSDEPTTAMSTSTIAKTDPYDQYRSTGWIAEENKKPGTTEWHIPDDKAMWSKIEGYSSATSIDMGQAVTLRVSTRAAYWQVSAYRMGYYGEAGGRMVWRSAPQPGVDQPRATVAAATKTWTAPWAPSLTIQTDATWPPGQYLLRLESADGGATFVPLVIRDDQSHSDLLVQSAVTTWQAYNGWGGASLYTGNSGRADVVTFDRPYTGNGSGEFLGREFEFVYFMERNGFDVSYWTDVDLDQRGQLATNHRAVIIPGHDEYYTVKMRQNLEAARDASVNIAFFGANNIYRRIRLEDTAEGPARNEVNYRDARRDPYSTKDPTQVTTLFRESPMANPESSLTGSYYECNPVDADWIVGDASMWMFDGSGFKNGDRIPHMVGNEYDRVTQGVPTPGNIQVLAHSPVTCKGTKSFADSTWYSAPSGAGVFAAGTFGWEPLMITACPNGVETSNPCRLEKVTETMLRAFSKGPAGAAHPSVSNLESFGIPAPRVTTPPTTEPGAAAAPTPSTTVGH